MTDTKMQAGSERQKQDADVLIVGAGMAGLAAARVLAERGLQVIVVEARDRVGGRVYTEAVGEGVFVEHGAEFVHGRIPELWALLQEAGLETVERQGTMLREDGRGGGVSDEEDREEGFFSSLEQLADLPGDDLSFAAWLEGTDLPAWQRDALTGYVEGFNAADARRISARSLGIQQRVEDASEGDRGWHLPAGYARLPEYLAEKATEAGADIRLGVAVHVLRWREGEVVLSAKGGDLRAPRCVITLPLGVLHAANSSAPGSVRIEPEPRPLFEARRLAMGHVVRFTMVFRERWWAALAPTATLSAEALQTASFLFTPERMPPVWWTRRPELEQHATLVGWVGGPCAEQLRGKTAAELGELACRDLAEAFGIGEDVVRDALTGTYTYDWSADPYAGGSYSYVPVHALDAPDAMTIPVADTLFFAGEHTETYGYWGTVHAALRSGLRAAQQIGKG